MAQAGCYPNPRLTSQDLYRPRNIFESGSDTEHETFYGETMLAPVFLSGAVLLLKASAGCASVFLSTDSEI